MLTRAQKEEEVAALRDKFARAATVIVTDYRGIDVPSINRLRGQLRGEGPGTYEYRVTKNSLLRRASEGSPAEALRDCFDGPTSVAFSYEDPVGLAKILVAFAKEHEVFEIKGGLIDGRAVGAEEIGRVATLPSLDELRAKLVGLVQAPAGKLARVLAAPAGQLARVVEARRAGLEESQGGA